MLPTSDGGAMILGGYYGYFFDFNSWMLKVDSNGNEERFENVNYQTCNDCENVLYDIELAPDGGYITAGYFINWAEDSSGSTWLRKVDACCDLEWQGCSPLNVPEWQGPALRGLSQPKRGAVYLRNFYPNQSKLLRGVRPFRAACSARKFQCCRQCLSNRIECSFRILYLAGNYRRWKDGSI